MSSTSEQPPQSKAFALLAAIVAGDTAIEDVIAELRSHGIDSVEATVNTLKQGVKQRKRNSADVLRPISLQRSAPTSPELVADIVQRVPKVPWTLNGVLYDPEDITRFSGQELHFIASPSGDHMMAVDDRTLIQNWWQLTYLEQYRQFGNRPGHPSATRSTRLWDSEFGPIRLERPGIVPRNVVTVSSTTPTVQPA